jgi:hypothetical protein
MTDIAITTPPRQWAIVELFGHQRIAGVITEQQLGGASFVRVDVPEVEAVERVLDLATNTWQAQRVTIEAHARSFGAAAIFSINWVPEADARLVATGIKHRPVSPNLRREGVAHQPPTADDGQVQP